uniref:Phosphatase PAP2 family protein n=1 Tax=Fervidicoccus fontis TaxID=683846 RepID=A0A7J3ZLS7_9CREN
MERPQPRTDRRLALLTALVVVLALPAYLNAYSSIDRLFYDLTPRSECIIVKLLTHTASVEAFVAYSVAMIAYDLRRYGRVSRHSLEFLVALALSLAVVALLKATTKVPRPEVTASEEGSLLYLVAHAYAFPSGHTTRATVLASIASRRLNVPFRYMALYPVAIGATRMLLGAHWFSDVFVAIVMGYWIAALSEKACNEIAFCRKGRGF